MRTRPNLTSLSILILASFVVFSAHQEAHGHELAPQRELLVQAHPEHFELLLSYYEPAGPRTDLLVSRSAGLDDVLLHLEIKRRATLGLQWTLGQTPLELRDAEIKVRRGHDGSLTALWYLRVEESPSNFVIRLDSRRGVPSLAFRLQVVAGVLLQDVTVTGSRSAAMDGQSIGELRAGQSMDAVFHVTEKKGDEQP